MASRPPESLVEAWPNVADLRVTYTLRASSSGGTQGRRGARPLNGEEQRRMYIRDGQLYTVTNDPPQAAVPLTLLDTLKKAAVDLWAALLY